MVVAELPGPSPSRQPDGGHGTSCLLEADDVARYLGMRTDWVYREVRAGRLPHIRLGRAVRFRRDSIEAWLAARERGASSQRP